MGTTLASAIILKAQELASDDQTDDASRTWNDAQALGWLNEAQLAVCGLKNDAKTINRAIQLTAGTTRQTISGRQLLSVIRNMGSDGNTPGRAIRLVDRGAKDESDPDWHTETPSLIIKEYISDDRDDKVFYVSPAAHGSTQVFIEVLEAIDPTELTSTTDPIDIDDIYGPALIEWIMYRFFGRDSEETPNYVRANGYKQNFYNLLGYKAKAELGSSPKKREQLN